MQLSTLTLSRRTLGLGAATTAVATAGLTACGRDEPASADRPAAEITYATGFGTFGRESYAYVAEAKGFFAEQNLRVTIEPGAPATNTQALLAGEIQFTSVDATGLWIRHGLGNERDTVVISALQQLPTMSLITLDLTAPQELAGAVIGAAPNGITETLFPTYAQLADFDGSKTRFEHMDVGQLTAALVAGQVDAIALFLMSRPAVETAAQREVTVLPYSDYLSDLFGAVHITSRQVLADDPELVGRFNTALLRGLDYAIGNPDEAGEIMAEAVPESDPEITAAELTAMAPYVAPEGPTGSMGETKAARGIALLEGIGEIPGTQDIDELLDEMFAFDVIPGGGQ